MARLTGGTIIPACVVCFLAPGYRSMCVFFCTRTWHEDIFLLFSHQQLPCTRTWHDGIFFLFYHQHPSQCASTHPKVRQGRLDQSSLHPWPDSGSEDVLATNLCHFPHSSAGSGCACDGVRASRRGAVTEDARHQQFDLVGPERKQGLGSDRQCCESPERQLRNRFAARRCWICPAVTFTRNVVWHQNACTGAAELRCVSEQCSSTGNLTDLLCVGTSNSSTGHSDVLGRLDVLYVWLARSRSRTMDVDFVELSELL